MCPLFFHPEDNPVMIRANRLLAAARSQTINLREWVISQITSLGGLDISPSPYIQSNRYRQMIYHAPLRDISALYADLHPDTVRLYNRYDRYPDGCTFNTSILSPWRSSDQPVTSSRYTPHTGNVIDPTSPAWDLDGNILVKDNANTPDAFTLTRDSNFLFLLPDRTTLDYWNSSSYVTASTPRARTFVCKYVSTSTRRSIPHIPHGSMFASGNSPIAALRIKHNTAITPDMKLAWKKATSHLTIRNISATDYNINSSPIITYGNVIVIMFNFTRIQAYFRNAHPAHPIVASILCQFINAAIRDVTRLRRQEYKPINELLSAPDATSREAITNNTSTDDPMTILTTADEMRKTFITTALSETTSYIRDAKQIIEENEKRIAEMEAEKEELKSQSRNQHPMAEGLKEAQRQNLIDATRITRTNILCRLTPIHQKLARNTNHPGGIYEHRDVWVAFNNLRNAQTRHLYSTIQIIQPDGAPYPHPHVLAGATGGYPCIGERDSDRTFNVKLWNDAYAISIPALIQAIRTFLTVRYSGSAYAQLHTVAWHITDTKGKLLPEALRYDRNGNVTARAKQLSHPTTKGS